MVPNSALIGGAIIPSVGTLNIEETNDGYRLSGYVGDEIEKLVVLRNLGWIRKGKVEHAKFVTKSGYLIDEIFEIAEARFEEEEFPDYRRLVFIISLKQLNRDECEAVGGNFKSKAVRPMN